MPEKSILQIGQRTVRRENRDEECFSELVKAFSSLPRVIKGISPEAECGDGGEDGGEDGGDDSGDTGCNEVDGYNEGEDNDEEGEREREGENDENEEVIVGINDENDNKQSEGDD